MAISSLIITDYISAIHSAKKQNKTENYPKVQRIQIIEILQASEPICMW